MSTITTANARAMANALLVAANEAEAKGQTSFELLGSLQAQAQAALDDLQATIDATKGTPAG